MLGLLGSMFLRVASGSLWIASTAVLCTGAAAVALVVAIALGAAGAMVIAVAVLVFAGVFEEGDPGVSYAAVLVVSSAFLPVAVTAGSDVDPALLLNDLFDAARELAPVLRAVSQLALDMISVCLEALVRFLRSHLG